MEKLTFTTLSAPFEYEIPKIKGSRFITTLIPLSSKEELETQLSLIQKKYYDATHNCYARRLETEAQQDLFGNRSLVSKHERANDDGEPSNTAGKPILSVLKGNQIFDSLAVVTRYFWGTLLGVWGLIQAYTEATKAGLSTAPLLQKEITKKLTLFVTYEQLSLVHYLFSKYECKVIREHYGTNIEQEIEVNAAFFELMCSELQEKMISFKA